MDLFTLLLQPIKFLRSSQNDHYIISVLSKYASLNMLHVTKINFYWYNGM